MNFEKASIYRSIKSDCGKNQTISKALKPLILAYRFFKVDTFNLAR